MNSRQEQQEQCDVILLALRHMGKLWQETCCFRDALEVYQQCLVVVSSMACSDEERHIETCLTHNDIGDTYKSLGQYHQSMESYEKSIKQLINLFSDDPTIYLNKIDYYILKED